MMIHNFQEGDRVQIVSSFYPVFNGCYGTICGWYSPTVCCIEFEEPVSELSHGTYSGHDCEGKAPCGFGWNFPEGDLVPALGIEVNVNSLI